MTCRLLIPLVTAVLWQLTMDASVAQDSAAQVRRQRSQEYHLRDQQRTGIMIPMYVCPADIHKNADYNLLMAFNATDS